LLKGFSDARASFQPGIFKQKKRNLKEKMSSGVNNGISGSLGLDSTGQNKCLE